MGTASMVISAVAATASADPGSRLYPRLERMRCQQRLGNLEAWELREEFRGRIAHGRIGRDPQLFLAVADLRRRPAAVAGQRERIDDLAVGRVDRDVVANGHGAVHAAGFLRVGERELLDARLEDGEQAGLEARGIDALEHLRLAEFRLEDLLDQVLVRGSELRLVVDAGARFLVRVVAGFRRHHHADLGRRLHDERLGQVAFRAHRHFRAAAQHQHTGGQAERNVCAIHAAPN